VAEFRKNTG